MKIRSYKVVGGIGMLLSIMLLTLTISFFEYIVEFFRIYVSDDQLVNSFGVQRLKFYLLLVIGSLFILSLLIFFGFITFLIRKMKLEEVYVDLQNYLFSDKSCGLKNIGKYFFFVSSALAVIFHFLSLTFGMPPNDRFIDDNSALIFLFSSFLIVIPMFRVRKLHVEKNKKKILFWWFVSLFVVLIFIYGEEVCWGQQYFSIETTGVFKLNYQNENTFHNFFNPLFKYMYPIVAFTSFIVLTYYWFVASKKRNIVSELIVPHKSLFVFFLLMAGSTYSTGSDEMFELYLAFFSLMYVLRIVLCVVYPGKVLKEIV